MRRLMWVTIGFGSICGLCAYVLPVNWLKMILLITAAGACAVTICGTKYTYLRKTALILACIALGAGWYILFQACYLAAPASLDGKTETVTIRTADYSEETSYGISAEGTIRIDGKTYRVRAYLDSMEPLEPGMLLSGPFRFDMTAPAKDHSSYLSGEGIYLIARQEDELTAAKDPQIRWQDRIAHLRRWLKEAIRVSFPEDTVPFGQALLLGDTSAIDYETDTNLKVSGIRHVIAVSGLHVSILMALLSIGTFRKKYLMVPAGLAGLLLFAALAGFTPSVVRACTMSALLLLALLFNREYDGATALSFAVLLMMICNPLVIVSVSFQLSAASVAGIFLFDPRIRPWLVSQFPDTEGRKWKQRLIRWFSTSVSVSLSAMTLTTPLCAYYFGMVSLIGVITNLLTLWIISGIFYGIMAVCLMYGLWVKGAAILARIISWPMGYVLTAAEYMADFSMAAVYTDSIYIVFWLIFIYILLGVFLFSKKRSPLQLLCCGVLGLCIALLASWRETGGTKLTVLDVGQGQCILLQSEGKSYMVDCGGDTDSKTADLAAAHLLSRGITRLDGLIITHMDRDHAGAVKNLLSRIDTELLVLPPVHSDLSAENTVYAQEDLYLQTDTMKVSIYCGAFPGTSNEKSLCVLFDTEKCDILITGDRDGFGERMLLRNAEIPPVDVLIAGHHGSKNSTCKELLTAVSPEIVCISAGKRNVFGHPAPELLRRLEEFGCTVYRTDTSGTITIRR